MKDPFEVGDVVQLKSGGEAMTVESCDGNQVLCVWSEGKKVHRDHFAAGTLRKYSSPGEYLPVVG